jgi:hypothetical protein
MGCTHCSEDSTKLGEHMSSETFGKTLDATWKMEALVKDMGLPVFVLFSGGECTEHPDIVKMVEEAMRQGFFVTLVSNGMWLNDPELKAALLRPEWTRPRFNVQVTSDVRFYPTAPPQVDDDRLTYVPQITHLISLGRAARKKHFDKKGLADKKAPGSFNFRSLVHATKSIEQSVLQLRMMAYQGKSGWCTPNIDETGTVRAGESRFCATIGTVDSTTAEMAHAVLTMGSCNTCGLEDVLDQAHKRAIGLSSLYLGTEV